MSIASEPRAADRRITESGDRCGDALRELRETGRVDSDRYTLADFYDLEDDDIFTKAFPAHEYIADFSSTGCFTYRRPLVSPCDNRTVIRDETTGSTRPMIMMASNNYLGLINHPKVVRAGVEAYERYGAGGSSAPYLSGTFDITLELERKLAEFKGCEAAMVFPAGYSANVGIVSALLRPGDVAVVDKLDHASIIDGCRLSGAALKSFGHMDVDKLERCLKACDDRYRGKLVITDGVFGMDGDICPLPDIVEVARRYNARVMVDDAHATGVIGKTGRGTTEHFGMGGKVDLVMGTFSKSLGGIGGFVASKKEVITYIRLYARSYFFSAALPPCICATVKAALEVIEEEPGRIARLHDNVRYLHGRLEAAGLTVSPPGTAVLSVLVGDELTLRKMSRRIHELGLYINPLPYPSVPRNQARFKFSLMATHTREDLDEAADIFRRACKESGII